MRKSHLGFRSSTMTKLLRRERPLAKRITTKASIPNEAQATSKTTKTKKEDANDARNDPRHRTHLTTTHNLARARFTHTHTHTHHHTNQITK